jgi:hypothetical protein
LPIPIGDFDIDRGEASVVARRARGRSRHPVRIGARRSSTCVGFRPAGLGDVVPFGYFRSMERMTPVDAQWYWMSEKIPGDQFLLYGFAGAAPHLDTAIEVLLRRAAAIADLTLRVVDVDFAIDYPYWIRTNVCPDQVVVHDLAQPTWNTCLDTVGELTGDPLDLREKAWRIHVFVDIDDVPRCAGPATIAVLQIGHALADGRRASAIARELFGRHEPDPGGVSGAEQPYSSVRAAALAAIRLPKQVSSLGLRGLNAACSHRQLVSDVLEGRTPDEAERRPALVTNTRPEGRRMLRTLILDRDDLPGPTVTVSALAVVSLALSDYLTGRGVDPVTLGAEVTMASPGKALARNNLRNVGVDLFSTTASMERRTGQIAEALALRRARSVHPALRAGDVAFAAVPAPLLRWGVAQFDPDIVPDRVIGNTVVSSINRGAADLVFGGVPVAFTAGYPALSPAMGITHGVHGIGDTVAISVHAAESAIDDIDNYLEILSSSIAWNRIVAGADR